MDQDKKSIDVDGGLLNGGNPGGNALAKIVIDGERRCVTTKSNGHTNNEAELFAILFGLIEAVKNDKQIIYSDSQWAIGATTMNWKIKIRRLRLLANIVGALIRYYGIKVEWKCREDNLAT